MKITTSQTSRGISWTFQQSLEDLIFADDIALLLQGYKNIQSKTDDLVKYGRQIGLTGKMNVNKTKLMKINTKIDKEVTANNNRIEEGDNFIYLGNKITANGDSTMDVENRISKARDIFETSENPQLSDPKPKLRIFKTNVIGVLLYGSESWKVTKNISQKLDTFQTRCLHRIPKIFWPNKITNEELYERTLRNTAAISDQIKERQWKWIGHVMRLKPSKIPRVALRWTPPGKRNRGRPKETWRRSVEKEMNDQVWTWGTVQTMAADRQRWRSSVQALCSQNTKRNK
ncbi:uncharacterized protein LOC134234432 [Saccostrea cucullata]|uniref:uncharacterized protein LOC134234432 n=1 Tax=Saccostrea cuccullata TaxID=36930 RepID=UPI002ED6AEDC